jgi:hypothetical protein
VSDSCVRLPLSETASHSINNQTRVRFPGRGSSQRRSLSWAPRSLLIRSGNLSARPPTSWLGPQRQGGSRATMWTLITFPKNPGLDSISKLLITCWPSPFSSRLFDLQWIWIWMETRGIERQELNTGHRNTLRIQQVTPWSWALLEKLLFAQLLRNFSPIYGTRDRLCVLEATFPGYISWGPGSIPDATRFSEKWVWNRVHSASWVQLKSYF